MLLSDLGATPFAELLIDIGEGNAGDTAYPASRRAGPPAGYC